MALWPFWADFLELGRPPRPTAEQLDEIRPAVVLDVRIDERGANALTDAPHAASSGSGPRLLFDRPFAYALVDWEQGWLIAVGRVDDPGL